MKAAKTSDITKPSIKKVELGTSAHIVYLDNGDFIICYEDGWGSLYNNNYECLHSLNEWALTSVPDLNEDEAEIIQFKKDANNFVAAIFDEIAIDGYDFTKIKKRHLIRSFEVLKTIKF